MLAHAAHLHAAGMTHHDRITGGVIPLLRNLASCPKETSTLSQLATRLDQLEKNDTTTLSQLATRFDKLEKTASFHEEAIIALEVTQTNGSMQECVEAASAEAGDGVSVGSEQHGGVVDFSSSGADRMPVPPPPPGLPMQLMTKDLEDATARAVSAKEDLKEAVQEYERAKADVASHKATQELARHDARAALALDPIARNKANRAMDLAHAAMKVALDRATKADSVCADARSRMVMKDGEEFCDY